MTPISKLVVLPLVAAVLLLSACASDDSHGTANGVHTATPVVAKPASSRPPTGDAVPDVSAQAPTVAEAALRAAGFGVAFVDTSGVPVADPAGYTFVSESPVAGTRADAGSTITITVAASAGADAPSTHGKPTAKCKDGTYSYSVHVHGTCSHDHGVAIWY